MLRAFTTQQSNIDIAARYRQRVIELEGRRKRTGDAHVSLSSTSFNASSGKRAHRSYTLGGSKPNIVHKDTHHCLRPIRFSTDWLITSEKSQCPELTLGCCRQAALAPQSLHSNLLDLGAKPPKLLGQSMNNISRQLQVALETKFLRLSCTKGLQLCGMPCSMHHRQISCNKAGQLFQEQSSPTGKHVQHCCQYTLNAWRVCCSLESHHAIQCLQGQCREDPGLIR